MPTAMINGPNFFKIRNKDFCNFLSIAMVMNRIHTFLVVYFPFPILIIYVFLTWNTFFNPKTLQKTLKNWVCSTPYIYTCVWPDVLIFSKSGMWLENHCRGGKLACVASRCVSRLLQCSTTCILPKEQDIYMSYAFI